MIYTNCINLGRSNIIMERNIELVPIKEDDKEWFIRDLQKAFAFAVVEEFGNQEDEIIPREDITEAMDTKGAETYHIISNGKIVGGVVVVINAKTQRNSLALLFINQTYQSKGIGLAVWRKIEQMYPETKVWETVTPYFEKRNIHFYVNKCGFKIVEFFNSRHADSNEGGGNVQENECMFRFEKVMSK